MMKLTVESIELGKSKRGGWSAAQFKLLGLPFPPPKGWKVDVIGKDFEAETIREFINLRGVRKVSDAPDK